MLLRSITMALVAISVCGLPQHSFARSDEWPICGRAKRITCIVDGDTFWHQRIKYRLQNIDAPETGDKAQCESERRRADAATLELQRLMRTPDLRYRNMGKDRYDRVLVRVETRDGDVGNIMIAGGYARPYEGGYRDRGQWCRI